MQKKKMTVKEAEKRILELERRATDIYLEDIEFSQVLDCLTDNQIRELRKCNKIAYGENYPYKR